MSLIRGKHASDFIDVNILKGLRHFDVMAARGFDVKTLAVLSRKGGAGKTTIALHLAVQAVVSGRKVALVDTDPQRSALGWWQSRSGEAPDLIEAEASNLASVLQALGRAGYDLAIIDTRPSAEADAALAARLADLSLIVVRPGILDLRAVGATASIVVAAGRPGRMLINGAPVSRGHGEASIVTEARAALGAYGLDVCGAVVRSRAALAHALIAGQAVVEAEPGGKAAIEIENLFNELEAILWLANP